MYTYAAGSKGTFGTPPSVDTEKMLSPEHYAKREAVRARPEMIATVSQREAAHEIAEQHEAAAREKIAEKRAARAERVKQALTHAITVAEERAATMSAAGKTEQANRARRQAEHLRRLQARWTDTRKHIERVKEQLRAVRARGAKTMAGFGQTDAGADAEQLEAEAAAQAESAAQAVIAGDDEAADALLLTADTALAAAVPIQAAEAREPLPGRRVGQQPGLRGLLANPLVLVGAAVVGFLLLRRR